METRRCAKCGETKPLIEFSSDSSQPLQKGYQCKRCKNAASREWKKRNAEKNRAQVKRWRERNPGKLKALQAKWYAANKETVKARAGAFNKAHPDMIHDGHLRRQYGVPPGTYDRLLAEQGGACAICGSTKIPHFQKWLHLDHCHDTGRIRGLLCQGCNTTLGRFGHDIHVLEKAIAYLRKYSP